MVQVVYLFQNDSDILQGLFSTVTNRKGTACYLNPFHGGFGLS